MRVTRLYVDRPLTAGTDLELDERAARYIGQVLRLRDGQVLALFNGDGRDFHARLARCGRRSCRVHVDEVMSIEPAIADHPDAVDLPELAGEIELRDLRLRNAEILLRPDDLLLITADHGCDPTWEGSDHTREHIPVLAFGNELASGSLGKRKSFADIGQSLATFFGLPPMDYGESFIPEKARAA